jgi:hypothetical protein
MPISIQHIPVEYMAQTWPLLEKHIASAEKFGGDDYTTDQIKVYLAKGLWQLFAAVNEENVVQGAATVLFQNYPNDRVAFVTTMGGSMMVNEEVLTAFKQVLKGFGATKLQGAMRPSMVRLSEKLGFVERYAIVEVKI